MATFKVGGQNQTLTSDGEEIIVTQQGNGYIGQTAAGTTIFTLDVNPATGRHTYTQYEGIDHAGPGQDGHDVIWLKFQMQVVDADGDTAPFFLVIDVEDDGPKISYDDPNVEADVIVADESDLDNGNVVVSDQLDVDFGGDGPGGVAPNGDVDLGGLKSDGQPIAVETTADGYVGKDHTGATIFTLDIAADGSYEFTLIGTVDHPDTNDHNDQVSINFGVNAADADGDTAQGTITVNINDDGPSATSRAGAVYEGNLEHGPITVTRTANIDFGEDGAGTVLGRIAIRITCGNAEVHAHLIIMIICIRVIHCAEQCELI